MLGLHHSCERTRFGRSSHGIRQTRCVKHSLILARNHVLGVGSLLGTVLLDACHIGVGEGDELEYSVSHVCALSPEHPDVLVISQDPGVLKNLVNLHSLGSVLHEELLNEILARGGDILPDRVVEGDLLVNGLAPNFLVVLAVEWQVTSEHQVDDDAE